jgi:hypothetical protein
MLDTSSMSGAFKGSGRWEAMQQAVEAARDCPAEVMRAVSMADQRSAAAVALACLLEIDADLAEDLIDMKLSEFLGQART